MYIFKKKRVYIYIHVDISLYSYINRYIIYSIHVNVLIYICWRPLAKNILKRTLLSSSSFQKHVKCFFFYGRTGLIIARFNGRNCSDIKNDPKSQELSGMKGLFTNRL